MFLPGFLRQKSKRCTRCRNADIRQNKAQSDWDNRGRFLFFRRKIQMQLAFNSKLPNEGSSIFSIMSQLAREYGAVNLSQGFPNFETDRELHELVYKAMRLGHNQYAPLAGIAGLREQIALKIEKLHGKPYDVETEICVTNGATQALFMAITAFVGRGDEVIVFKPAYDSYEPAIELNGGIPVPVPLKEDFSIDWELLKGHISPKTRMVLLNTPHNPSGKVLAKTELLKLESLLRGTDILLLSDEVYEHIVFDGHEHFSASRFPGLAERAVVCASFGKTFHNTGWKMGYCVAPRELMAELWKVQQVNVFCVNHPMQWAFAEYLKESRHYLYLREFYQKKRDYFLNLVSGSRFNWEASEGTYFQLMDFSAISEEGDLAFAQRLVKEKGIAAIPTSGFDYQQKDRGMLRFCFAKTDETLEQAAEILNRL